jgi:hypothetical protein
MWGLRREFLVCGVASEVERAQRVALKKANLGAARAMARPSDVQSPWLPPGRAHRLGKAVVALLESFFRVCFAARGDSRAARRLLLATHTSPKILVAVIQRNGYVFHLPQVLFLRVVTRLCADGKNAFLSGIAFAFLLSFSSFASWRFCQS